MNELVPQTKQKSKPLMDETLYETPLIMSSTFVHNFTNYRRNNFLYQFYS